MWQKFRDLLSDLSLVLVVLFIDESLCAFLKE